MTVLQTLIELLDPEDWEAPSYGWIVFGLGAAMLTFAIVGHLIGGAA